MPRPRKRKICPVCGEEGCETVKTVYNKVGKPYTYRCFYHYYKVGGRWKKRWCYVERIVLTP